MNSVNCFSMAHNTFLETLNCAGLSKYLHLVIELITATPATMHVSNAIRSPFSDASIDLFFDIRVKHPWFGYCGNPL